MNSLKNSGWRTWAIVPSVVFIVLIVLSLTSPHRTEPGTATGIAPAPEGFVGKGGVTRGVPGAPNPAVDTGALPKGLQNEGGTSFDKAPSDRQFIRTADLSGVTTDPFGKSDAVSSLALTAGGRVASRTDQQADTQPQPQPQPQPFPLPYSPDKGVTSERLYPFYPYLKSSQLQLRIPEDKLDSFLISVRELREIDIERFNISSRDTTDQLTDLTARIKAKRAEEQRYLALLAKAEKVDDLLRISQALSNVQTELERLAAQQAALKDQVSLSTVNITFHTAATKLSPPPVISGPGAAVLRALDALSTLGNNLIYLAVLLLPILLMLGLWQLYRVLRPRVTRP